MMPDAAAIAAPQPSARIAWVFRAVVLAAALMTATAAEAQARTFTTARGVTVTFDSVQALSCDALGAKLNEIDASGYRGNSPTPVSVADQPLFIYEHKVARALYTRCARDMSGSDVTGVMTRGFRN
jgi:hypothetical protein